MLKNKSFLKAVKAAKRLNNWTINRIIELAAEIFIFGKSSIYPLSNFKTENLNKIKKRIITNLN